MQIGQLAYRIYQVKPTQSLLLDFTCSMKIRLFSFDAVTGEDFFEQEEEEVEEPEVFVPMPTALPFKRAETIEAIIGVPSSMEIIRQAKIEEDQQGIVWREKDFSAENDKSMDSYIKDSFEQTVKATIKTSTNKLKCFV